MTLLLTAAAVPCPNTPVFMQLTNTTVGVHHDASEAGNLRSSIIVRTKNDSGGKQKRKIDDQPPGLTVKGNSLQDKNCILTSLV